MTGAFEEGGVGGREEAIAEATEEDTFVGWGREGWTEGFGGGLEGD